MAIDQNDLRSLNFGRVALPFATAAAPAAAVPVFAATAAANGYSSHHPWPYPYSSAASEPTAVPPQPEEAGPNDHHSSTSAARKVKFLCSFGGKILPRPSDGALRYVGGNTRIISLRKDASFGDLMQKMVDAYGGAVVLKYQLPDEDLDALVTVSCPEDLENMMEEYDKLVESAPDGSVKLRVFLFSPTEVDSSLGVGGDVGGQRYVDAVNGVAESAAGGSVLRRRGSGVSMSSTQNSDGPGGAELSVDIGSMEGTSSAIQSPSVSVQDVPKVVVYDMMPNPSLVPVNAPGGRAAPIPQIITERAEPLHLPLGSTMPQQTATFTSHPYVEPRQEGYNYLSYMPGPGSVQFVNSQQLGTGGTHMGAHMGLVTVAPQYMPQMRITTGPLQQAPFQVGSLQPLSVMEGGTYQTMMMPVSTDPNCKAYQNGPQFVPFLQNNMQESDGCGGVYAWQRPPVPEHLSQGQALRPEDCQHLCKNDLLHAHSDSVIQEHATAPMGNISESHMTYHSLQTSETMPPQAQRMMAALAPQDGVREQKSEGIVVLPQSTRHAFSHYPIVQSINEGIGPQKNENLNQNMLHYPPDVAGFPSNLLPMYGLSSSHHPQVNPEIIMQPQLQSSRTQGQQLHKQEILTNNPSGVKISPARNGMFQTEELSYLGTSTELSSDFVRPIGVAMEDLHVSSEGAGINEPIKTSVQPNANAGKLHPEILQVVIEHRDDSKDQAKEKVHLVKDTFIGPGILPEMSTFMPAESSVPSASSYATHGIISEGNFWPVEQLKPSTSAFSNTGIIPEESYLKQPEHLVPFASEAARGHYIQPVDSNQAELPPLLNPSRPGIEPEPPVPYKWLPATSNVNNKTPAGDQKEQFSQTNRGNAFSNISAPPVFTVPVPTSSLGGPNWTVGHAQESAAFSNSFFNDQDPWGISPTAETTSLDQTANAQPLPKGLASGESLNLMDTYNENYSQKSEQLNVDVYLGESPHKLPSNIETKDLFPELVQQKKEEQLKNDMHSVAEGVASEVFRPSISSPDFDACEEHAAGVNDDVGFHSDNLEEPMPMTPDDNKLEDTDLRKSAKLNFGFPITDDIGSIQIINNSDLEELKELGSGTFGTVYHGKWKGSDVAIKRINDRCFAGKPSEQERLRADFWNEACNLADLHHPNVVAFYGVVLDGPGGSVATVTEFMVNGSLRNALQRNDKLLDKRKRLLIAMDAAFGMEYLHGKNIVHFDLKSDNLLVNLRDPHRPICKVGDLGLSKVKCQTLISGGVRGTLPWMAPELLNGSSSLVSDKVDVFSFGIVLWELLTGEEPYADLHYGAIIGGILSNTLRPSVPDNCDPEWRSLMERCWSPEPSERPSFTEIAGRLRLITASLPQKGHAQTNSAAAHK